MQCIAAAPRRGQPRHRVNPTLFWSCCYWALLDSDGRCSLLSQPFILDSLEAIARILNDKRVFSYIHIPVQSGSNRWALAAATLSIWPDVASPTHDSSVPAVQRYISRMTGAAGCWRQ